MFNNGIIDTLCRLYNDDGNDESVIEIIDLLLTSTISAENLYDIINCSDLTDLL